MKRFARLFAEIDNTTRTTAKVEAMVNYFRQVEPADARGRALSIWWATQTPHRRAQLSSTGRFEAAVPLAFRRML